MPSIHTCVFTQYNIAVWCKSAAQEEERMVVLPRERCPEEARLGGEAVKHSDQMCQYITITPGCSGPAGLTGKLCLWPTTAGLFIISYSHSTVLSLIWSSSLCALCTLTRGFVISPKNPKAYSFPTLQACLRSYSSHVQINKYLLILSPVVCDWMKKGGYKWFSLQLDMLWNIS